MTRYDTSRADTAVQNLASCRVKADDLATELAEARATGQGAKVAKLQPQLDGALDALDAAETELDAARAAPPVPFVEPTEHVEAHAEVASGDGEVPS